MKEKKLGFFSKKNCEAQRNMLCCCNLTLKNILFCEREKKKSSLNIFWEKKLWLQRWSLLSHINFFNLDVSLKRPQLTSQIRLFWRRITFFAALSLTYQSKLEISFFLQEASLILSKTEEINSRMINYHRKRKKQRKVCKQ